MRRKPAAESAAQQSDISVVSSSTVGFRLGAATNKLCVVLLEGMKIPGDDAHVLQPCRHCTISRRASRPVSAHVLLGLRSDGVSDSGTDTVRDD